MGLSRQPVLTLGFRRLFRSGMLKLLSPVLSRRQQLLTEGYGNLQKEELTQKSEPPGEMPAGEECQVSVS